MCTCVCCHVEIRFFPIGCISYVLCAACVAIEAKQLGLFVTVGRKPTTLVFETAALQTFFGDQTVAAKKVLWHLFGHHMSSVTSKEGWERFFIKLRNKLFSQMGGALRGLNAHLGGAYT